MYVCVCVGGMKRGDGTSRRGEALVVIAGLSLVYLM